MIRFANAVLLFAALTLVMTWPQAARLTTDAWHHDDVFFNMWRFGWFAHALAKSPDHLIDGNIFYPEARTLTYSDAMVVESMLAANPAPLLKNLAEQLAVYSTGRGLTFSDRDAIDAIVKRTQRKGGGIRTLIHELVQSELFQTR